MVLQVLDEALNAGNQAVTHYCVIVRFWMPKIEKVKKCSDMTGLIRIDDCWLNTWIGNDHWYHN
jgi:hypothetical protein